MLPARIIERDWPELMIRANWEKNSYLGGETAEALMKRMATSTGRDLQNHLD